jgi:tetratricopeptide (TPR) repeat protein
LSKFSKVWLLLTLAVLLPPTGMLFGQSPPPGGASTSSKYDSVTATPGTVTVTVGVRDSRGLPLEDKASVQLTSRTRGFNRTFPTDQSSSAIFDSLIEGPYDVEVQCPGYGTVKNHLDITGGAAFFSTYIYLPAAGEALPSGRPSQGLVLTPRLANELDKGIDSMRKHKYDAAKTHFAKAARLAPNSSDIFYLQGTAELGLTQPEAARHDFERAVELDPSHEKALQALGELQLHAGDSAAAILTFNKARSANGAGWRTHYLLATAYAKTGDLRDAESYASSAVRLAHGKTVQPMLLLGDIQAGQGKWLLAKQTWERVEIEFPKSPEASEAQKKITEASGEHPAAAANIATPAISVELPGEFEGPPWAPPDIDSKEYSVAPDVACSADDVIPRAMRRMKVQLENLEKFGATEHIEHQEIDRKGVSGPIKIKNFYYLVFVIPQQGDSVFLEESRDGGVGVVTDFPTALATTGLNSLGVSVLQPMYRNGFSYKCEGLSNVRGEAAWQVRFEEKQNANLDVRRWQRSGTFYNIPLKGRIWLASGSYDVLKIETDLREPVVNLELHRDHLQVEYGPVNFADGKSKLWLPWSAEMYLEIHGKRYHHKHFLTDYILFGVDTSHKINGPKNPPPEEFSTIPSPPPAEVPHH